MATTIKVDIVSDTICPWCFIGKRRLEKAITSYQVSHPDTKFDIKWHPFELDPTLSKTPANKLERYAAKFGAAKVDGLVEHMKRMGKGDGINFSYGGPIANTIDSHRLIEWASKQGKQDEVIEQLFKLYFEDEGNIGDLDQLADVAGKIGLDKVEALEYLKTDKGTREIKDAILQSQMEGISGVPNFTIDSKYTLSGAQQPETFLEVFEEVGKRLAKA
ncbi:hypothetical protein INT44_000763 [Umbelopsis vinacea]|uniref:DSBA-like thioredoxin domain-containing protein n=1 Tax=Umbelopsis vinacea TaxID=44442 RepID=A0A8H7Q8K7_9FUNG|nr:hypothetical protein INT44_000763 [Umbelopsis vinacea]